MIRINERSVFFILKKKKKKEVPKEIKMDIRKCG